MADNPNNVTVSPPGLTALGSPNFIIEAADGTLYLSVALLEYSESAAGGDAEKQAGVANVRRLFEEGVAQQPLRACVVSGPSAAAESLAPMDDTKPGVNTRPFGVNTNQ